MKKHVYILLFLIVSQIAFAQVFSVGDTTCNYSRIKFVLPGPCVHPPLMSNSTFTGNFTLDIDGDLINDFEIKSYCNWTPGGSSNTLTNYMMASSYSNTEFAFLNATSCSYSTLIKNLTFGTPLNASLSWSVSPPQPSTTGLPSSYLSYYYGGPMGVWINCGQQTNNFYIGFRKIISNDTVTGWMLVNSAMPGEIISYAFKHSLSNSTVTPVFTSTVNNVCLGGTVVLSANPAGGVFNGAGVSGNIFNSALTGAGVHNVYYTKGCTTPAVKTITVHSPSIDFINTQTAVCTGYSLALTANPPGGTFSGPGVSGNIFYSSSTGSTAISYSYTDSYGCSNTKTLSIKSFTSPVLNISSTSSLSCPAESVTLSVNGASNYTWSTGPQTSSIVVNPTSTTVYTVTGEFSGGSCPSSTMTFTQSAGNPTITISGPSSSNCPGYYAGLNATGATSYTWSTGSTTYYISPQPTVTTTYSVVGANPAGCTGTASITVNVYVPPVVTVTSSQSVVCAGDPLTLYFNGSGITSYELYDSTSWSGFGITSASSIVVTPTNTITYRIRVTYGIVGGCFYDIFFRQNVKSQSNIISVVPSKTLVCSGDTVTLSFTGSKSYTVTIGSTTYTTNTSTLVVSPLTFPLKPYIVYGDSIVSGCRAAGYFSLNVSGCVGIQEINKGENQFIVYPNPNAGEFEIKSSKKASIIITNELGQLIKTVELNQANNFRSKINELQSGIYFIGDNYIRQKIVVIK